MGRYVELWPNVLAPMYTGSMHPRVSCDEDCSYLRLTVQCAHVYSDERRAEEDVGRLSNSN